MGKFTISIPYELEGIKFYKYFNTFSFKRKIYKLMLALFAEVELHRLLADRKNTPVPMFPDFPFDEWIFSVEKKLGKGKLNTIVTFPSQITRKRFYVHLLDLQGRCVGFSKVSLSKENDYYLSNEATNISKIESKESTFKVPKILLNEVFNSHKYLVFEPLPDDLKYKSFQWHSYPSQCAKEISKNTKLFKNIKSLSWWPIFQSILDKEEFIKFINKLGIDKEFKVAVALAHGDLHPGNMLVSSDEIWLFDWESSSVEAPIMTDEIVFFLAKNQRKLVSDPDYVAKKLKKYFLHENSKATKIEVGLALAYLATTGRDDAKDMVGKWDLIEGNE